MVTGYVGRSIPRLDARDKITGRAVYSADVNLPGMLYGATLRSPFAHARIIEVETSEARKAPEVKAVVTGRDFPFTFGSMIKDQPFLAIDRVRYVGEPVAAVAAETLDAAQEALGKIRVRYEELPAVFDPREAALDDAPLLHPNLAEYSRASQYEIIPGTNICTLMMYSRGDVEAGFAEADEVFEDEFYVHAVAHSPMETHAAVAQWCHVSGKLTIWSSTDRPHRLLAELTDAIGVSGNWVQFISTCVGGSFGGKSTLVAEALAVALARFTGGRPVKVVFSREEELKASQVRVAASMKLKTGVKSDGIFTSRRAEVIWDSGAYAALAPGVAQRGVTTIFGPYRIPNLELLSRLVYTNKEVSGAYRGYGTTQVTWGCEVQVDIIAEKLGIDPLEIRLRNGYVDGDRFINGQVLHGVGLRETLEEATREIGWNMANRGSWGTKLRGRGIATMLKGTATPTESRCIIKVNGDGSTTILSSSVEIGGGQKTVLAQIVADTIGVPIASISIPTPDTDITPFDHGTCSSRTTYHMGNAVRMAGEEVRKKILELAGDVLGIDPVHLSLSEGEVFEEGGDRGKRITLKALMKKKCEGDGGIIMAEGHYTPAGSCLLTCDQGLEGLRLSSIFWMFATHAVEVEVDTETGVVKVLRIAAAHDVGRPINPLTCEQQIEGAVVMGLSNTLFEEFKTENGRILNNTLADYKLATMLDIPEIVPIIVETYHQEGPFGAKGIGEPAAAPTAAAISNAIFNAVGIRIRELPITPERVLAALSERGDERIRRNIP
ncbi:MAG: xanthine dehydrogenase family protein molybdopterin-binding subunit [Promethearchaeota archaeon]